MSIIDDNDKVDELAGLLGAVYWGLTDSEDFNKEKMAAMIKHEMKRLNVWIPELEGE